ncbi:MAG: flagellar biosynthesis protein FlhF [Desulfobulbaceae bacterium]|nr:flagellar biosynthesis protein FlhF [Desulfobulbaceae bacterium]HIJ91561.1 flagellar biosynthesis protein FlhF [Deltaproteobacteria bacterium]
MRIKRFEASDTHSAMAMVKEELGEDAVILSTRNLPGKSGSARGGPRIEVVAAMEYDPEPEINVPPLESPGKEGKRPKAVGYGYHSVRQTQPKTETRQAAAKQAGQQPDFDSRLSAELCTRSMPADRGAKAHFESNDLRLRFANFLRRQYCAKEELESRTISSPGPGSKSALKDSRPDPKQVAQWRDKIIDQLQITPLAIGIGRGPTVMAMIGPTGVGKTTTAAKIAAWYSIHEGLKVALLSMDCYRIGATDQLRTYAKIMRLPCEIALRKKDLQTALLRHQDKDLIIIDTAGKSPYDPNHIRELGEWFSLKNGIEPYLVLSATCKKEDLQQILAAYEPLRVKGLILSKLDETRAYATLCQLLAGAALPISCLCTGQRVPEDFLLASREFLQTLFGQGWQAAAGELASEAQDRWAQ